MEFLVTKNFREVEYPYVSHNVFTKGGVGYKDFFSPPTKKKFGEYLERKSDIQRFRTASGFSVKKNVKTEIFRRRNIFGIDTFEPFPFEVLGTLFDSGDPKKLNIDEEQFDKIIQGETDINIIKQKIFRYLYKYNPSYDIDIISGDDSPIVKLYEKIVFYDDSDNELSDIFPGKTILLG